MKKPGKIKLADEVVDALVSLNDALGAVRDKAELWNFISSTLKASIGFHDAGLALDNQVQKQRCRLTLEETSEAKKEFFFSADLTGNDLHKVILHSQEPVSIKLSAHIQEKDVPEYITTFYQRGIREIIGVAMRRGIHGFGIFYVCSEKENFFTRSQVDLLRAVSYPLSATLVNLMALEELEAGKKEEKILLGLSNDIASTRNKQELLQLIHSKIPKLFPCADAAISCINDDGTTLTPFHIDGTDKPEHNHNGISGKFQLSDGILDTVLASEVPVVFDVDILDQPPEVSGYVSVLKQRGVKEIAMVALRIKQKAIGMFWLQLEKKQCLDRGDLNLMQVISRQLSVAVANIFANDSIEKQLQEIDGYKKQLEAENLYLQNEIETNNKYTEMVGGSSAMQKVYQLVSQVAPFDSTVLILGETGTGKELIARAIHNASSRKDKLMVKVNCAALPANLIESELFGHEKGSFTGATERRIGKFEMANNGTLFLDEIGEMPLELQVKLLRALQEKEIERVGGKTAIKVDVRIIAATNRNLQLDVLSNKFRSDLFYRLNVFPLSLPPLRERKEDLPALVSHFINRIARKEGKKVTSVSNKVLQDLVAHDWPGNVRELEHLIERSVLLTHGTTIKEMHVPVSNHKPAVEAGHYRVKTLAENERDHILAVIKKCNGKISGKGGAAELLGIPATTLNSKIKKLGIRREHVASG